MQFDERETTDKALMLVIPGTASEAPLPPSPLISETTLSARASDCSS
jgi:hypothetical protein